MDYLYEPSAGDSGILSRSPYPLNTDLLVYTSKSHIEIRKNYCLMSEEAAMSSAMKGDTILSIKKSFGLLSRTCNLYSLYYII